MGDIYRISCPECGSMWEVSTGHGLIHGFKEKVVGEFPEELWEKGEKAYSPERSPLFSFRTAVCDNCRAFTAVPALSDNITGEILVAGFCRKCQNKNVRITDRPENELCPSCGREGLEITNSGHWD